MCARRGPKTLPCLTHTHTESSTHTYANAYFSHAHAPCRIKWPLDGVPCRMSTFVLIFPRACFTVEPPLPSLPLPPYRLCVVFMMLNFCHRPPTPQPNCAICIFDKVSFSFFCVSFGIFLYFFFCLFFCYFSCCSCCCCCCGL